MKYDLYDWQVGASLMGIVHWQCMPENVFQWSWGHKWAVFGGHQVGSVFGDLGFGLVVHKQGMLLAL